MKRLRNIISWILIMALCCGELTPQLEVYAAGKEVVLESAVSEDDAVSEDEEAAADDEAVSDNGAVSEDDAENPDSETVSEDSVVEPIEEDPVDEEWDNGYDDGLVSDDVDVEDLSDEAADSFVKLTFKMRYDQKEGRQAGVSVNAIRKEKGKEGLTYDNGLELKACLRAAEAAIYYSNTRPDGREYSTIYNDIDSAKGKAKKEILIREGADGTEAASIFRSVSLNSLISDSYHYMAVGHVVFQGKHYWALELTEFPVNLANRNATVEDVSVNIDLLEKYIAEKGVEPSLAKGTKIKVDQNKAKELPTFKGYVVSKEHLPEKAKLSVTNTNAPSWKVDSSFGTIKNNKLTATAEEGTESKITATVKFCNEDFSFTYPVRITVHVKSMTISINNAALSGNEIVVALDEVYDVQVKVFPPNADDKTYTVKSNNDKVAYIESITKPTDDEIHYRVKGAGAGSTSIYTVANDTFHNAKATVGVQVLGVDEVTDVDIYPTNPLITGPTDVRLYCPTPDAEIWYLTYLYSYEYDEEFGAVRRILTEGERIKSEAEYTPGQAADYKDNKYFTLYTEPFAISGDCAVRAVAVKTTYDKDKKKTYKISDYLDWEFMLIDDWGDVAELDRGEYDSPSEVPKGLWISASSVPELKYTGKVLKPDGFRVFYNTKLLQYKKDYTIKWNAKENTNAGKGKAIFTFKGNYSGTLEREYEIKKSDINDAQFSNTGAVYTGKAITPKIKVVAYGKTLKADKDYRIVNAPSILEKGEYSLEIEGINNFTGTCQLIYNVVEKKSDLPAAKKLQKFSDVAMIDTSALVKAYDYVPGGVYPVPVVKRKSGADAENGLQEGVDYLITYKNCNKAGKATIVVSGLESAGFKGSISYKFKINKVSLKNNPKIAIYYDTFAIYEKGGSKTTVDVAYEVNDECYYLTEGVDFTVSYSNNKSVTGENTKKLPTLVVKGKGSFKDSSEKKEFKIWPQNIGLLTGTVADKIYTGKPNTHQSAPVIYDNNGKKLISGTDYEKHIDYRYDENCLVYVSGKGSSEKDMEFREAGASVGDKDIVPAGTVLHASVQGKGNYMGYFRIRFKVTKYDISKAKISIADQTYTGKEIELDKKDIRFSKMTVGNNDYEIVSYSSNVNVGTAKVVLRGKGQNFGGVVTVKFKIKPDPQKSWLADRKDPLLAD